jgi:hypothetical protein
MACGIVLGQVKFNMAQVRIEKEVETFGLVGSNAVLQRNISLPFSG